MCKAGAIRKRRLYGTIFVALALFFTLIVVGAERNAIYRYDVKKDYIYDFSHAHPVKINYQLRDGKVHIKSRGTHWDAVFLKVRLKTTLLGHFFDPKVFIKVDGSKSTQTVERGAEGIRYLNLSNLNLHGGATISISGDHVKIKDQQVTLIYLNHNISLDNAKILVIAPHPDDAEIAAFGLYSRRNTYVVTITAGDAGGDKYDEIFADKRKQFIAKGKVRVWNSLTVPMLGGVDSSRIVNLGYFDGTLPKMHASRGTPVSSLHTGASSVYFFRKPKKSALFRPRKDGRATWDALVMDLQYIIKKVKPDIIVAPYPRIDWHSDHQMSTIAVIEALKALHIKNGSLFLYTNHEIYSDCYPYGSVGEAVTLPPSFNALYFDSIYSYKLLPHEQKMKLLALDAMNDLRLDTEWRFVTGAAKLLYRTLAEKIEGNNKSYFRRAVRANELFFVVDIKNLYKKDVSTQVQARGMHYRHGITR